jgi:HSP90 family molecular chaperone
VRTRHIWKRSGAKGYEVLYMVEPIDELVLEHIHEFGEEIQVCGRVRLISAQTRKRRPSRASRSSSSH